MQANLDPSQKFWAVKEILAAARTKCQEVSDSGRPVPPEFMLDLIGVIAEATDKVTHVRWVDTYGLNHGVEIYRQIIKNL